MPSQPLCTDTGAAKVELLARNWTSTELDKPMSIDPAGHVKKSVLERLAYAGAILDQSGPLAVEAEELGQASFSDEIPRSPGESTQPDAAAVTPRQVDAPEGGPAD